jgi:hypothetical protein
MGIPRLRKKGSRGPGFKGLRELAADLFKIGGVIKSRTLISGMAVSADAEGYFFLNPSLSWVSPSFTMAGFTLNSL